MRVVVNDSARINGGGGAADASMGFHGAWVTMVALPEPEERRIGFRGEAGKGEARGG